MSLIPVSGVQRVVDEGKTGGKAENSGTPRTDMVRGWDDSEKQTESLKHLEPMHVHWMICAKIVTCNEKHVRMRAFGEVLSVHTPSRSQHL